MEGACFLVQRIVGEGCAEPLLCAPVTLSAPARSIKEIQKTVLIDDSTALIDKVILQGRLLSQFLFPVAPSGALILQDVQTAFTTAAAVPEAAPGMQVTVTAAFVAGSVTTVSRVDEAGLFLDLVDRSVLHLAVRVSVQEERCGTAAPAAAVKRPAAAVKQPAAGPPRPVKTAAICHFAMVSKKPRHD